jgi:hypothetical protein
MRFALFCNAARLALPSAEELVPSFGAIRPGFSVPALKQVLERLAPAYLRSCNILTAMLSHRKVQAHRDVPRGSCAAGCGR